MKKSTKLLFIYFGAWSLVFLFFYLLIIYSKGNVKRFDNAGPKYNIHIKQLVISKNVHVTLFSGIVPQLYTYAVNTNIFNDTLFVNANLHSGGGTYEVDLPELEYAELSSNGFLDATNYIFKKIRIKLKDQSISYLWHIDEIEATIRDMSKGYFYSKKANLHLSGKGFCELNMTNGMVEGEIMDSAQVSIIGNADFSKIAVKNKGTIFLNGKRVK